MARPPLEYNRFARDALERVQRAAAAAATLGQSRDDEGLSHLLGGLSRTELRMMVRILACCADGYRLSVATGGEVPLTPLEAHRLCEWLKGRGLSVPEHVRRGERRYQNERKRAQRAATVESAVAGSEAGAA